MKEKEKKNIENVKQNIYTCPHCNKHFTDSSSWYTHISLHTSEDQYSCSLCDYKCKIKKYLTRHVKKVHTKPKGPQCGVCGKTFHYDCNLRDHMRVHTGEKPHKCDECGKAFSSIYTLSVHTLIHTGEKPYQCMYCDYSCRDNSTIRRHQERHLGISKVYPCTICNKNFKEKRTLQFHIDEVHFELETRTLPCDQCPKVFKTKGTLNHHIRAVHLKTNLVKCTVCGAQVTPNNIVAHNRRHIDVKPYKCSFGLCGRQFKVQEDLKRHTLIHYPDRHCQCTICHRKFTRKARLNKHMLLHKNEKSVQCDYCGIIFLSKVYLSQHIKKCHSPESKEYVCHVCNMVNFTRRSMIRHLKYGHGTDKDTECKICKKDYKDYVSLKEHYLVHHHIVYTLLEEKKETKSKEIVVPIKQEPLEFDVPHEPHGTTEFMYEVNVQKQEVEDPDDVSSQPPINYPEDADTITYSKKVLSEDISRSLIERGNSKDEFDDFFVKHVLKKPKKMIEIPDVIVDEKKKETVEKRLKELLNKIRFRREIKAMKKLRKRYNKRIKMAANLGNKKEPKSVIRYFKKPEENNQSNNDNESTANEKLNDKPLDNEDETNEIPEDNNKSLDKVDKSLEKGDKSDQEGDDDEIDDDDDEDYEISDEEKNTSRNMKFHTHQCYICFKLFKTKLELKRHCQEHFDICNDKMLKKCPFCGYVTNLQIQKHIKLVHKIFIDIPYTQIKERDTQNGSKYVYEINKNCDLEIIPSISNLNKIASMKIDEKKRERNNLFLGTTKLIRKGGDWVVEKQPLSVNSEYMLPEFEKEDYEALNFTGNTYLDRIKNLSLLAKKRGLKILYPCIGCDKICLTLSALKLHNRKHEDNPKAFKPKVWKNKILNGYGDTKVNKRKKKNNKKVVNKNENRQNVNNKTNDNYKPGGRRLKIVTDAGSSKKNTPKAIPNRFAEPNPVRNNHNCDRKLIQFYHNNIKGGDIEFWQFLKIFNKMSRENVNNFEDLENRYDFGIHATQEPLLDKEPYIPETPPTTNSRRTPDKTNIPAVPNQVTKKTDKNTKKTDKNTKKSNKNNKKTFTRAIMISKKDYLKRNEMKNEMRKKFSGA